MGMFCFQCEQTMGGLGCTRRGVCGKSEEIAALQDALRHVAATIAFHAADAAESVPGARDERLDRYVANALFTTITNVDFDPAHLESILNEGARLRETAARLCVDSRAKAGKTHGAGHPCLDWQVPSTRADWMELGQAQGVLKRRERHGESLAGVIEMAVYGLKGAAAYAHHAAVLGKEDPEWYRRLHKALAWLTFTEKPALADALALALQVGEINLTAMKLLDEANTATYGHPVPAAVRVTPVAGKAILVSGHDLKDLRDLLEQTAGKGINIYTHGEMLPCHGYPELKKYPHLAGNYGGAWQNQQKEFAEFPGAILMTTNCIQQPRPAYQERLFTTGLVAFEGVRHVENGRFGPVIEAALAAPGFAETAPEKTITVGFGRQAVLGVAGQVIEAVKSGALRHFFLVGGCDGDKPGRNYYTEFVEKAPPDTVILTLACGKYRFNKGSYGDIGGIPRLLDIGQCNDAYSAVVIAQALAEAFGADVNGLPLSLVLSWYEQKAVAVLLTLLHLGVRNIRLGPTLPAFVTPEVLQVLVDKFAIKPIGTPAEDLAEILGAK